MQLPIIQALWIGNNLSQIEQVAINSFLRHGHQFHLYTYQSVQNIPEGCVIKDANEIIAEKHIFTYGQGSLAGFADWFRWTLLYEKGSFYVDLDVICLKPFHFQEDLIFGWENNDKVCPAVIGFPPKHKICEHLMKRCSNPLKTLLLKKINKLFNPNSFKQWLSACKIPKKKLKVFSSAKKLRSTQSWGEFGGPEGFTVALKKFNLLHLAKTPNYFYPIHCSAVDTIFDNTYAKKKKPFPQSYAIHLWNEMLRKKISNKNHSFPASSLFCQLKKDVEENLK